MMLRRRPPAEDAMLLAPRLMPPFAFMSHAACRRCRHRFRCRRLLIALPIISLSRMMSPTQAFIFADISFRHASNALRRRVCHAFDTACFRCDYFLRQPPLMRRRRFAAAFAELTLFLRRRLIA